LARGVHSTVTKPCTERADPSINRSPVVTEHCALQLTQRVVATRPDSWRTDGSQTLLPQQQTVGCMHGPFSEWAWISGEY
jgi:hypothetical protein